MAPQRICVIGDSHAAALKAGWDAIEQSESGREITFFAAPLPLLEHLAVEDGRLVPTDERLALHFARTSRGGTAIAGDYDANIVCGQSLGFGRVQQVYNRCRMTGMAPHAGAPQLSRDAFEAAADEHVGAARAIQTLEKLRRISKAPTLLIAMPIPTREREPRFWVRLERNGDKQSVLAMFRESCARLAARHGAVFLPQPAETFGDDMATRAELARDAARLSGSTKDDLYHMNAIYGEIVLRAALAALDANS